MPEPLCRMSRKPQEVRCDTRKLVHMDTCKVLQETNNTGTPRAQVPPDLPGKLPKPFRHSWPRSFVRTVLAIAQVKAEPWPDAFALAQRLGCPCFMHPQGQVWPGTQTEACAYHQQCIRLASVPLTSRRSGHGGSAKIPKSTSDARAHLVQFCPEWPALQPSS